MKFNKPGFRAGQLIQVCDTTKSQYSSVLYLDGVLLILNSRSCSRAEISMIGEHRKYTILLDDGTKQEVRWDKQQEEMYEVVSDTEI